MSESLTHRVLRIRLLSWYQLVTALRARGRGRRESGAFLLGRRSGEIDYVTSFVLYDDLDPSALAHGFVMLNSAGFAELWKICRKKKLNVLGDIHTHPGSAIQSASDQANPMISEPNHVAIILPNFAAGAWYRLDGLRVFEYLGNYRWKAWAVHDRPQRVKFSLL